MELTNLLILLIISFLSSVMGTLVGMAMIILLPVMIFLGVPVHTAIATGRFSVVGINLGNIGKFSRQDRIKPRYFIAFASAGVVGSLIGAVFLTNFSEKILKEVIGIFMIIVSVLVLLEEFIKSRGLHDKVTYKHHLLSAISGLFVGSYVGIIGGGAATIIIFLLILIYGLNFNDALANQKAITLPISIIATIVFIYQGLIDYKLGIPLFIVNFLGGWFGASIVKYFNSLWIKRLLVPVTIGLAIKLIFF